MKPADWKWLALLLLVALAVRLGAAVVWERRAAGQFLFGDSESYWELGRAIAEGRPYQYGDPPARVFRTPGYPLLLAPLFLMGGGDPPVFWARAENAILGTLCVAAVWWLGRSLFDERCAWIAAAIAAVYPGAIALSGLVLAETPFCLLMLVQLALWAAACQAQTPRAACAFALAAGLAAGAATLVRPSWLVFTPLAGLVGIAFGAGRARQAAVAGAMLGGLVLVMVPWWARNAAVTGRFVPTTLQVGASLYDGLNPQATGASDMRFVPRFTEHVRRQPGEPLEVYLDRRMREQALSWARQHPGEVGRLALVKLCRLWNLWPNEPSLSTWPVRIVVALGYVPVLLLGLCGAAGTIRRGVPYWLCWLPAVYFTALHVIFVSSIRYRQPAMLGLIVLAAGAVVRKPRTTEGSDPSSPG
jgi:4-amino-4-deoxy-L-arabinose transferase-like glycosyltransferase